MVVKVVVKVVKFTDRKDFIYDPTLFQLSDTKVALKIYAEWIAAYSPKLPSRPKVIEVDRSSDNFDPIWHVPLGPRTQTSRELEIPMIIKSSKNKWNPDSQTKFIAPIRTNQITFAHNHLQEFDYFPMRGDYIMHNGYRNIIVEVEIPLESYWGQTNVWMGLICHTEIAHEGDSKSNQAKPETKPAIQTAE